MTRDEMIAESDSLNKEIISFRDRKWGAYQHYRSPELERILIELVLAIREQTEGLKDKNDKR